MLPSHRSRSRWRRPRTPAVEGEYTADDAERFALADVDEYDLPFPILSGSTGDLLDSVGVHRVAGLRRGIAHRSVFVVVRDRTVRHTWIGDEPLTFPDFGAVADAVTPAE